MTDVNIGKGLSIAVNFDAMPAAALQHLLAIGARNVLMDSHASITKDEPDFAAKSLAVAEKKLAALMAGDVRVSSARESDPVKAEALRIATRMVEKAIRAAGGKVSDYDAKSIRDSASGMIDEAITKLATQNVAKVKALPTATVDIAGLTKKAPKA